MSGSPKITKRLPLPVFLRSSSHVEIGVHASLQDRDPTQLVEIRRVRFVVEGARDQHVKARVRGLPDSFHQIGTGHGAEFGADEDAGALLVARIRVTLE